MQFPSSKLAFVFRPDIRVSRFLVVSVLAAGSLAATAQSPKASVPAADSAYGKLPLSFEVNQGQTDPRVHFLSRGSGYSLFLTDREAVLALSKRAQMSASFSERTGTQKQRVTTDVVRMQFEGARRDLQVTGEDKLPGTANYFVGNDPAKWNKLVPTYAKVSYRNIYPGVDLVYYGNQRQLEYDFVVAPGADPQQVKLHFAGADKLKLDADSDLVVVTKNGEIAFHKPVIYQNVKGNRQTVDGKFELLADTTISFAIDSYDKTRELIIDPTLEYSTYLGAAGSDYAAGIAVDSSGNTYVTGYTLSTEFPTTSGSYQPTSSFIANSGTSAIFITKLNAAGSALEYSTYLSGTESHCTAGPNDGALVLDGDYGSAIAVDGSGHAYVTGGTCANDFPTTSGAFQTTYPSVHHANNAFITKLNSAGSELLFSTYLGGIGSGPTGDWANAIAIDTAGNSYVTGQTSSTNFPTTTNAFQTVNNFGPGYTNAFVTKMNATGTALVYSTYLGGSGNGIGGDSGNGIAINSGGNAYVAGFTYSQNFPVTTGAYQTTNPAYSATGSSPFVTEINSTGTALVYSTFIDGSVQSGSLLNDSANGIALDAAGNVYIAGNTDTSTFPVTSGAFQTTLKSSGILDNAFITKLNPTGTALVYSTFLGGSGNTTYGDRAEAISLDSYGDVFLTGSTGSNNFPLAGTPYQSTNKQYANNSGTPFLTELNPKGSALLYSSYFGGSGSSSSAGDYGAALTYSDGNVYFAGATISPNFPITTDAYQKTLEATSGNTNVFVAEFVFAVPTKTTLAADGNPEPAGTKVTFTANVTPSTGTETPTGTVAFAIDGGTAVKVALDDTGHASYSTTSLALGSHTVVATYSGDPNNLSSSASVTEMIEGPAVSLSPSSLTFSSTKVGSVSASQTVTITNTGAATLDISGINATGTDASSFFVPSRTCGSTLAAGANCTLSIGFRPKASGTLTGSISITDNAGNSPQTIALTGTGVASPVVKFSVGSLSFPSTDVGATSASQAVTLTNTGDATLTIAYIISKGADPSSFFDPSNTCGTSVAAGASCTINIAFRPKASGALTDTIYVNDNAAGGEQGVNVSGTGIAEPLVTLSPTSLTFASTSVGSTSAAQTVTLKNTGDAVLDLSYFSTTGTDASSFAVPSKTCGSTLAVNATCTFNVTFKPQATGALSGDVAIHDNAVNSPQGLKVSGTGK